MDNKKKIKKMNLLVSIFDFTRLIVLTCIVALLFLTFGARKMEIVGPSMYPTLEENETVFINIAANFFKDPQRFDVVAVKHVQTGELWVKRVIGLPNETIEYKDDVLYVNGVKVEEDFLDKDYMEQIKKELGQHNFTSDYVCEKLGADEYLLVGDNRTSSLDSRNQAIGPFKREQIIAQGVFVVMPFSKARYITDGN